MLENVNLLTRKAASLLDEMKSVPDKLVQIASESGADVDAEDDAEDGGSGDEDKILAIQLTLQYRLGCEDALNILLNIDHHLLYFLGIQLQHSAKVNMERLAYAVGNEDLKQILSNLATLCGYLSKIVARYKNSHASFALKERRVQKHSVLTRELSMLLVRQDQFLEVLHKLDPEIEQFLKLEAADSSFEYIAALRDSISSFYQTLVLSLEQAKQLYYQVNKKPVAGYQLDALLQEAEQVLHLMPGIYGPRTAYPVKQFDKPMTSEQLEQRATAKRLRPFFG